VPVVVYSAAKKHANTLHGKLPEEIRNKIPENITSKIQ
jgi:predicted small metal-binding protein